MTSWHDVEAAALKVVGEARASGVSLGCAESCTGGMVSAALTSIPGSSEVVRGGVVSYDPAVKHDVLGVSQRIIDAPEIGVVSSECAAQMCVGASQVLKAQVCVSVTGIAGPGGAEPEKPVGTVWFGLCVEGAPKTQVRHFEGDRESVRLQAVHHALELLFEGIAKAAGLQKSFGEVAPNTHAGSEPA